MKWLPRTLFGQIALALFVVLVVVQMLGLWLLLDDRGRLNYKLLAEYSAQRMAGIATVLDLAEPAERPLLVKALSVQPTMLTLSLPWATENIDGSIDAQNFASEARRQLAAGLQVQMLALERVDPLLLGLHPPPLAHRDKRDHDDDDKDESKPARGKFFARTYIAQIRLHDGVVVTFHHLLPMPSGDLPYRLIALLVLLGGATTGLSIWAVRRLTRPLARFTQAASGLAKNLNQAPMPEVGPQDVRQAVQAFNTMQRDVRRLVDTRAQALSAVSHDLRLPITRMRLRLEGDVAPELREKMQRDLGEMDAMIGHTLDFLRAGSDTEALVAVNLDALLDSVIEDMEELGARITREGRCNQPLKARPHGLRRCIANLLDNARFYGGDSIRVSVEETGTEVRIRITDQGPGIPESELEKVFEPYFRLESSRARHTGGTGLGLPIAKAIAEAHGGSLSLQSKPGEGVTACIHLPRRAA
ncbi:ATP-binding protein [Uliginosibacterium aquaticum]|uniref:histidine kinase n=1 Tax=Uliginosibacterium aquaticum TaxID=2731212 RepID=A0ABX2IC37_9RHOO|nr:ATP-binding protein [Uliginosibacterium aquaticum]NSL53931.1 HAMP domain-containing protein [Uliginosibacterium aquaticum]